LSQIEYEKRQLRKNMERMRDTLPATYRADRSRIVCDRIIEHVLKPRIDKEGSLTLFSYVPFRSELNVRPVIEWGWESGLRIVLPRVNRKKRQMTLHRVTSFCELEPNRWGILEPTQMASTWTEPVHIVLIPGLAFVRTGARLGYGGGYYDRWIAEYSKQVEIASPLLVAAAFEQQLLTQIPTEAHDVKVDIVLTEHSFEKIEQIETK